MRRQEENITKHRSAVAVESDKSLIAVFPEPIFLLDAAGRVLECNPAASALLSSCGQDELLAAVSHPPTHEFRAFLRLCARSKSPLVGAVELSTTHGIQAYKARGAVIKPASEQQPAVILLRLLDKLESNGQFRSLKEQVHKLSREIAKRRRLEHDLQSKSRWLEVTLASIGDAVVTTDAENRVTFMNPVAEAMTGWKNSEATLRPLQDIFVVVNEFTGDPVENPAETALRSGEVVALANHALLIARDGTEISIEDTAAPIILDGKIEGAILVFHDVSSRRLLQKQLIDRAERLEHANQRKTEFMTMLAHELRSPLAPISNAVELLALQSPSPAPSNAPQQVIARQIRLLKRLVDDMLDVSRIARGKMNLSMEIVDICSIVRLACDDLEPEFRQARICLNSSVPETEIWVRGDGNRLTQVVHSLLGNAAKFTARGGSANVAVGIERDSVVICVGDTGIGIDQSVLEDLFEPFAQAAQPLDRNQGGLGLGLSLVKGIVDLHGGEVSVSSRGVNAGATFTILLPVTAKGNEVEAKHEPPRSMARESQRILLIEDEDDTAQTMQELLEELGHEVHTASTGPAGLKKAAAVDPTLIICDIGLPGLDGFEVARRIRQSPFTASVLMVALTGYGDKKFVEKAIHAGFDRHVTKPAALSDLMDILALVTGGRSTGGGPQKGV
jgi:PAS domain S-box-containing protein